MEKNAPGRSFLKVTGILCIIYGVFLVLSTAGSMMSYQAMTSGNMTDEVMAVLEQSGVTSQSLLFSIIYVAVGAVIFLVAGILGVMYSKKTEKAGICVIMGILLIVYFVFNFGYSAMTTGVTVAGIISTIVMLIVPFLYLWGGLKNKEVNEQQESEKTI